jgi:hypothetical protein
VEVNDTWDAATSLPAESIPELPPNTIQLTLNVVTAAADAVRVQVVTSMRIAFEGKWDTLGFDFLELEESPDAPGTPDMALISWFAGREQASVEEAADFLEQSEQAASAVLNTLVEQGILLETREQGRTSYHIHFTPRRRRQATTAIWQALDSPEKVAAEKQTTGMKKRMRLARMQELMQGEQVRSWLALSPLLLIFLVVEWLFVQKLESFSEVIGFVGVVAVAVLAGAFPVLLLLASRRKGENVPGFILPFLAHPLIAGTIYLVSVSILFLHGLFIWQNPFQRVIAILVGVVILAITFMMVRRGTFARRLVIELRQDPAVKEQSSGTFMVTDCGQRATQAKVELGYVDRAQFDQAASGAVPDFSELCSAKFYVPGTKAQELMLWIHRVTAEGQSENLPALVKVFSGQDIQEFHLDGASKQFVLPLQGAGKKESKGQPRETDQIEVEVQLEGKSA